ncbi:Uncharacterised protein [Chlamydia trachomatis]|nr:Uncharacterised protein [Chlamydia trachomatis]
MYESINEALKNSFYSSPAIQEELPRVERAILEDKMSSFVGANKLLNLFYEGLKLEDE